MQSDLAYVFMFLKVIKVLQAQVVIRLGHLNFVVKFIFENQNKIKEKNRIKT